MTTDGNTRHNREQHFGSEPSTLDTTDPEFMEYFGSFAFGEVVSQEDLDLHTCLLAQLAALVACQARGAYRLVLGAALANGVSPVETKEILYQAVAYLGFGKVFEFLHITNHVLAGQGVALPLPDQSTTVPADRFEKGWDAQARIVGEERLAAMHGNAPADERHFQDWLTANCFGDLYTRGGLDLETRELLTFVLLVAHGGCDPQVRAHVAGNLRVGNDRARLLAVLSQLVPYIGYPRTLNGLQAINDLAPAAQDPEVPTG